MLPDRNNSKFAFVTRNAKEKTTNIIVFDIETSAIFESYNLSDYSLSKIFWFKERLLLMTDDLLLHDLSHNQELFDL